MLCVKSGRGQKGIRKSGYQDSFLSHSQDSSNAWSLVILD